MLVLTGEPERQEKMRYVQQRNAPLAAGIPDNVLVGQAYAGDEHAFEALVGRYHGPLLRYIRSFLNDDELAYDVLQFVFLQLHTFLATLMNTSPKGWLFQVARNRCLDELRTRQRRRMVYFSELERGRSEEELSPLECILDSQPLPEEIAEQFDLHCMLQRAMFALSPKSRSIVHLHCSRELSFSEIGRILEMPVPTVKAYFYRSLPRLRTALMAQEHSV
jgi:RNA polymerase sigma factor (sigma-70 family)